MNLFIGIGVVTIIIVFLSVLFLTKKYSSKDYFLLPGAILSILAFIVAIVSFFTTGGFDAMGYGILFIFVAVASVVGTISGKVFARKKAH